MNFRDTIGHAIEAAATGAVGTGTSIVAYIKQIVTNTYRLAEAADGTDVYPASVANDSIFAKVLAKGDPAVASTYNNTTDSQEAIRDQLDTVPASGGAVTWNATALASVNAEVDTALNTIVPASPTAGSVNDILSVAAGANTFVKATDSLEAIRNRVDTLNVADQVDLDAIIAEVAKVPKSDAAVTWNGTALGSINAEVDTALNTIVPASPIAGSVNDILSVAAGANTFVKATDSLEAIRDRVDALNVADQIDLDAILADTGTDGVVVNTFTAGGKAELQTEANDALVANSLDHLQGTAVADTSDPVDLTAEVVDNSVLSDILTTNGDTSTYDRRSESLQALKTSLDDIKSSIPTVIQALNTTQTTRNASVTLFALDALAFSKKRVAIGFYLALDAAATFTPGWYATREGDVGTFTVRNIPAIATIATPAANARYSYEYGDLPKGAQLEFRIAQDNLGAANVACDAVLTYEA